MHPAAAVEIRTQKRLRARVHVEPHPTLAELTTLTFSDAEGTDIEVELSLSLENLTILRASLEAREAQVSEFLAGVAESRSAVRSA